MNDPKAVEPLSTPDKVVPTAGSKDRVANAASAGRLQTVATGSPHVVLSLQRLAGNRATTRAVGAARRPSALDAVGARLRSLVGGSRSFGPGSSSFAQLSAAVDTYNRGMAQGRARAPQDRMLARIDEMATTWVNGHRGAGDRDRRSAVMELLERVPEERRRVTDIQASNRYLGDLAAGGVSDKGERFAATDTPFLAATAGSRVGAAQIADRSGHKEALLKRAAFLGYSEDLEREYEAFEEAEKVGMSPAEQAAIRAYTGGDYHYINPATANSRGWMGAKLAKPPVAEMQKPDDGSFEDVEADKAKHQLAVSGDDRWVTNLMQDGALHAALAVRGLAKLPRYTKPHYRGEGMAAAPARDSIVTLATLTSTTSRVTIAQNFIGQTVSKDRPVGVLWVYTGGAGADIRGLSAVQSEAEVLVPPGTRYRVAEVKEVSYLAPPMGGEAAEAFAAMQAKVWEGAYKAATKLVVVRAEFVPDARAGAPAGPAEGQAGPAAGQRAGEEQEQAGSPGSGGPGPSADSRSLRFAAMAKATKLLMDAKAVEPRVTKDLKAVAGRWSGKLVGLEHRMKTMASLTRKLEDRARTRVSANMSAVDAVAAEAAKVNDVLRYTIVAPAAKYSKLSTGIGAEMSGRGYQPGPVWNAWALSETYKGINLTYSVTPSDGTPMLFELQLHTRDTFDTKSEIHDMYEEARAADTTPERKAELNRAMAARWADVEVPEGIYSKPPSS